MSLGGAGGTVLCPYVHRQLNTKIMYEKNRTEQLNFPEE